MDGSANASLLMSGKLPMSGLAERISRVTNCKLSVEPEFPRLVTCFHVSKRAKYGDDADDQSRKDGSRTQNLLQIWLSALCISWRVLIRSMIHDVILK